MENTNTTEVTDNGAKYDPEKDDKLPLWLDILIAIGTSLIVYFIIRHI